MGLRRFAEKYGNQFPVDFRSTGTSYLPFSDQPNCSGYGAYCERYRLANYQREEILLCSGFSALQSGDPDDEKTLDQVMEHTGGQPLLVEELGRRMRGGDGKEGRFGLDEVEEAMRFMRSSPPSVCAAWQEHLQRTLDSKPELAYPLKSYLRGESLSPFRFPPPAEELELHLGGWVGLNSDGHWGIASRFHAYLASQVIDQKR